MADRGDRDALSAEVARQIQFHILVDVCPGAAADPDQQRGRGFALGDNQVEALEAVGIRSGCVGQVFEFL